MSPVEVHLALNHFPVAGLLLSLLLLGAAVIINSRDLRVASLALVIVSALFAVPVFLSGNDTEELIEQFGVSDAAIERHEDMAEISFFAIEILGAIALIALAVTFRWVRLQRHMVVIVLLMTLAVSGLIGWTAKLGGEIRHGPELGRGAPRSPSLVDQDD